MTEEKKAIIHIKKNNAPVKERIEDNVKSLSAKLSPEYDQDLIDALAKIPKRERSKLYRDAVRLYLKQHPQ